MRYALGNDKLHGKKTEWKEKSNDSQICTSENNFVKCCWLLVYYKEVKYQATKWDMCDCLRNSLLLLRVD